MARPGPTKKITRGPNKGDTVRFKIAKAGNPYPVAVIKDVGKPSNLRDNPGVKMPGNKGGG